MSKRYEGPIIDVDIHHSPKDESELLDYLPARWREYGETCLANAVKLKPPRTALGIIESSGHRADSYPESGPSGSSLEILQEQLLDPYGIWRGVLTHDLGEYALHRNVGFSVALCRAANDWNIDRWLGEDDRLYSGVLAPAAVPDRAVEEIHRLADHPKMSFVFLAGNALDRPLGEPVYHPIYRAAAEVGLPIQTHPAGRPAVGGPQGTAIEALAQLGLRATVDTSSLIVSGLFDELPELRFLMTEFGLSWIPSLLDRLDRQMPNLRVESPSLTRTPSEYVRKHIKFSTQPLETTGGKGNLLDLLQVTAGISELLCFSTDYPHWSMDDLTYVERTLPSSWHRAVFCDNACEIYGWDAPVGLAAGAAAG